MRHHKQQGKFKLQKMIIKECNNNVPLQRQQHVHRLHHPLQRRQTVHRLHHHRRRQTVPLRLQHRQRQPALQTVAAAVLNQEDNRLLL